MRRVRWSGIFAGVLLAAYFAYSVVSPLLFALLVSEPPGGLSTTSSGPLDGLVGGIWLLAAPNVAFLILSNVAGGAVSGKLARSAPGLSGALAVVVAASALLGLFFLLTIPLVLAYLMDGSAIDWGEGASNLLVLATIYGVVVCMSAFFGFLGGVLGGRPRGRPA